MRYSVVAGMLCLSLAAGSELRAQDEEFDMPAPAKKAVAAKNQKRPSNHGQVTAADKSGRLTVRRKDGKIETLQVTRETRLTRGGKYRPIKLAAITKGQWIHYDGKNGKASHVHLNVYPEDKRVEPSKSKPAPGRKPAPAMMEAEDDPALDEGAEAETSAPPPVEPADNSWEDEGETPSAPPASEMEETT
ncbi:MAG: hypothetical protein ABIJ96_15970, partial [Elusimicrobiota bacterium]